MARYGGTIMKNLSLEEMKQEINLFIEEYWGTSIGERVYHRMCNTWDTDYDGIIKTHKIGLHKV